MTRLFDTYAERVALNKALKSLAPMVWVNYLLHEKKCSSLNEFHQIIQATDPATSQMLKSQMTSGFMYRKSKGQVFSRSAIVDAYEELVPGSAKCLSHPLFRILNCVEERSWYFDEVQLNGELQRLPTEQRAIILNLNERLNLRLQSPLKLALVEKLADAKSIDALASLQIVYVLCQKQYVRPSFFWALEKTMFRIVIKMFSSEFHDSMAFPLIRATRFLLDDIDDNDSRLKTEVRFSNRKKRYQPIFFHRISSEQQILKLLTRIRALKLH